MSASCANSSEKAEKPEQAETVEMQAENTQPTVITLRPGESLPAADKMPVVIDFFATWCGPCRSYAPIFDKVAEQYSGKAVFVRVDVDQHNDLAGKYRIQSIPTTVVLTPDGGQVTKVGLLTETELTAILSPLLAK